MPETGYCAKCKDKREIKDGKIVVLKNKRKGFKGVCSECGTSVFRMLGKESPPVEKVDMPQEIMAETGYCVKCREKREIKDGRIVVLKNKRKGLKGACTECGTSIFRMAGKETQPSIARKETQPGEKVTKEPELKTRVSRSSPGKKKQGICVEAGKLAGKVTRGVYPICQRVSKVGASAYQGVQTAVKKGEEVVKDTFSICAGRSRQKELTRYEKRQCQLFAQLGTKVFQLKKKQAGDIFGQAEVKEIIKELNETEQHLRETRKEIETRRLEKESKISFNQAIADLKNNNSQVRLSAIRTLASLGKKEAISCLTNLLADPDETVRKWAAEVIKILTGSAPAIAGKPRKKPKREAPPPLPKAEPEPKLQPEPEPA